MSKEERPMRHAPSGSHRLWLGAALAGVLLAFLPAIQPVQAQDEVANQLTSVEVRENEETTEIVLKGTRPPTFTVFKLSDPTRLFIDVAGADISAIQTPIEVDNGVIGQITALQFSDDLVAVGRLIVGLQVDAPYSVKAQGGELVVTVDATARTMRKPVAARPVDGAAAGAAVAAAEARVREAERRAEEASQRAREAEERARLAEERAQGATLRADELAQARAKDSEVRGTADAARLAAEAQAREAAAQAAEAAVRLKEAEARAAVAEARAREAEARAAAAESVARNRAADVAAADAAGANDVAQAQARARAAAQEAAEAEARARTAETRSREAEARAAALAKEVAEARSQAQLAEAKAQAADRTAADRIAAAEARIRAEAEARAAADQAAAARIRAEAEERIRVAAEARAAADRAAEARIRAATEAAAAADARALAAAGDAEARARLATESAQKAQDAATRLAAAEKRANEAETRAARAEARAAQAEADKQRLAADLAALEQQRTDAEAQMARLESEQARLAGEVAAARAANDAEKTRVLEAEERARGAALAAERARVAQLESAKAASSLDQRVAGLESELEKARAADRTEEVSRLQGELASVRGEGGALRAALQNREDELAAARAEAERSRAEAARLAAELDAARRGQVEQTAAERAAAERAAQQAAADRLAADRTAEQAAADRIAAAKAAEQAAADRIAAARAAEAAAADRAAAERAAADRAAAEVAAEQAAADRAAAEAAAAQAAADRAAAQRVVAAPETVAPVLAPPALTPVRITQVKFEDGPANTAIRIGFSGKPVYRVTPEGERTRVLEFQNARIDPALERTLDTSEFQSAVQIVSSFQAPPPGDRVRIVVTLSEAVTDELTLVNDTLSWTFGKPKALRPVVGAVPPPPAWSAPPPVAPVKFEQPEAAAFTVPMQPAGTVRKAPTQRRYSGRRINIDIKDGDIHNILRLLAKEGNVNIVTSDDVSGTVTVHLKLVPWDQALDIILRTKGLGMVRDGDIIRVAPADVLAKERDLELQQLEVKEKLKPLTVKLIPVNYADASDLLNRVKSVLSDRGKAEFDARTNTVIVNDVRDRVEAAEDIISRLDTQTPQVLIEARIVEVNTVDSMQLGIQWGGNALMSPALGNGTGLRFPSVVGIRGGADDTQAPTAGVATVPNFVVNLPAAAGGGSGGALGLSFGSIDGAYNLNVRLSAFENRGTVKIVSSPKIATLDNKEATISQGVSIPISQVSAAGTQTVFFDAVLKLVVTPHVTQDGNIYLKIKAENNTPDFQNVGARGDPTILKKEATTELLLKDGDTTVIGGIYTSNAGQNTSEVPYLARIPILGAIFRNYQETDRRTELLIFVTPKIVNRSAAKVRTAN